MTSRWDSLKCDREAEPGGRGKHRDSRRSLGSGGAGAGRGGSGSGSNRWAATSSRFEAHKPRDRQSRRPRFSGASTKSQQQQQQQQQLRQSQRPRVSGAVTKPQQQQQQQQQQSAVAERDALVDSLKLHIARYQSSVDSKTRQHEKSILIEILSKLFPDSSTKTVRYEPETATARLPSSPTDPELFATLLTMLDIDIDIDEKEANHGNVLDDKSHLRLVVARSIESFVRQISKDSKDTNQDGSLLFESWTKSQIEEGIATMSLNCNQSRERTKTTDTHATTSSVKLQHASPSPTLAMIGSALLVSIAVMVRSCADRLAPEWTARNVVGTVFLPYLSSSLSSSSSSQSSLAVRPEPATSPVVCICEALIVILERPSHASAILAPLVESVSILLPGCHYNEEQTTNPLRQKLLRSLLYRLESPASSGESNGSRIRSTRRSTEELAVVCRTLSACLDAIRKLRKGNDTDHGSQNKADVQIVMKPLEMFLRKIITECNDCDSDLTKMSSQKTVESNALVIASLNLLRAFIACYPNEITGLGWKLVIEGANQSNNLVKCQVSILRGTTPTFASSYLPSIVVLRNSIAMQPHIIDTTAVALTMECLADFISALPWNRWLQQSSFGKSYQRNTSGLYKTVVNALCTLLQIAKDAFESSGDKTLMSGLGRLIKALFLEIPYCDSKLILTGVELWKSVSTTIRSRFKPVDAAVATAGNKDKLNLAFEILQASSGGTVTPQGHLCGMSVPLRTWFLGDDPFVDVFVAGLIESFEYADRQLELAVKILSCVLRTLPDVALRRWKTFGRLFREMNTDAINRTDQMRLEVLESFMLGRKDFEVSADLQIINDGIISGIDELLLKEWGRNGRRRRLTIYSAFRSQDWLQLDRIEGRILDHFDQILDQCNDSSAKIREGAAKALGEFCSRYIIPSTSSGGIQMKQYSIIADTVRIAMSKLSTDQNAAARSMAIFCLGNLTNALNESNCRKVLNSTKLQEISRAILVAFDDCNDKVVKNAIRSIGHTGNSLSWSLRWEPQADVHKLSREILVELMESLTQKLSNTLYVACNEEQKAAMTWKERSAAKKHGWGACHSLGLVFEGLVVETVGDCDALVSACSKAARCLVRCVCKHTALNEKVVLAAMAAFGQLPGPFLARIDSNLGDALAVSLRILEGSQTTHSDSIGSPGKARDSPKPVAHPKLDAQNKDFLCHVLGSASIGDATLALAYHKPGHETESVSPHTLGVLYAWMVESPQLEALPARAFEVFAIALHRQDFWSETVGLEQRFTSRAIQKRKQEQRVSPPSADQKSHSDPGAFETEGGKSFSAQATEEDDDDEEADEL